MYIPPHFYEDDPQFIKALMRNYPLATMVVNGAEGLIANLIPMVARRDSGESLVLDGHIARNNMLWQHVEDGAEAIVLFQGARAYIRPNWYPAKKEDGKVVPTWDYSVVQCRGSLYFDDDRDHKRALVTALTESMENGQPQRWTVEDAPAEYVDTMLDNIVGFRVHVSHVECKVKANQNHPVGNRIGAAVGLREQGDEDAIAMARVIESRRQRYRG